MDFAKSLKVNKNPSQSIFSHSKLLAGTIDNRNLLNSNFSSSNKWPTLNLAFHSFRFHPFFWIWCSDNIVDECNTFQQLIQFCELGFRASCYLLKIINRGAPSKTLNNLVAIITKISVHQPDIQGIGPNWTWKIQIWEQPNSIIRLYVDKCITETWFWNSPCSEVHVTIM